MMHRCAMLGILDEDGYPLDELGVMPVVEDDYAEIDGVLDAAQVSAQQVLPGKPCSECGAHAVIRRAGCDDCAACGALGSCG